MTKSSSLENYAIEICKDRNFNLVNFEGSGSFKETFKIKSDSRIYALKLFFPSKFDLKRTEREIESMKKCRHPNIGKLYEFDSISVKGNDVHFTVEEFLDDGSLTKRIKQGQLDKTKIKSIGITLVDCLEHLQVLDLVHRDIKPDNIMFDSSDKDSPVLVDFGLVRVLDEKSLTPSFLMTGPGTPVFSAPEQLNNDKALIDWKTDQFSLGIVLSYCFLRVHPFLKSGENFPSIINRIANKEDPVDEFINQAKSKGLDYLIRMVKPWPHHRFQNTEKLKSAINS